MLLNHAMLLGQNTPTMEDLLCVGGIQDVGEILDSKGGRLQDVPSLLLDHQGDGDHWGQGNS